MQFLVPQFVDVEDKIIGPLTIKQFFILLGGGFVGFVLYKIISSFFLFILTVIPVAAISLIIAFGRFNGRTVWEIVLSGASFLSAPKTFVFKRGATVVPNIQKEPSKESTRGQELTVEEKRSRLQKLTYLLDQDLKSENELLKDKYINLR